MIPFAETALLIILQQQACDLPLIGGISFFKVWMVGGVGGHSVYFMETEALMGELGVSEHGVSP